MVEAALGEHSWLPLLMASYMTSVASREFLL